MISYEKAKNKEYKNDFGLYKEIKELAISDIIFILKKDKNLSNWIIMELFKDKIKYRAKKQNIETNNDLFKNSVNEMVEEIKELMEKVK